MLDFFITHLCEQKLGLITSYHVLLADNLPLGAKSKECL